MRTNETHQKAADSGEESSASSEKGVATVAPNSLGRRSFFGRVCASTALAAATGAQGNSTALVGTPETVAKAMLEYYKLGATSLLIRGYDPRPDAVQYGEELIPRLRELVAAYDAESATSVQSLERSSGVPV